jgi:hypothetical protein
LTRRRGEAAFAVLFAAAILVVAGTAFYFVSTITGRSRSSNLGYHTSIDAAEPHFP